jgi:DNA-binding protein HU-beta
MNKVELVNQMVEQTGLKKKDVEAALGSFIDTVTNALAKGDKVQLIGFGTFETRDRAARSGRNPQTGAAITIPAAKVPAFKVGAKLKEAVK